MSWSIRGSQTALDSQNVILNALSEYDLKPKVRKRSSEVDD